MSSPAAAARDFAGKAGRGGVPKPASENICHSVSDGNDSAIFAAPTFDDFWITCSTVSGPARCASWIVCLPIVSSPASVWITVSGRTLPASSAAAIVNGFIVEPGSNVSVSARLRIFSRATLSRRLGLYVGQLASARISPLFASMTTRPPAFALLRSTAALQLAKREVLQPRIDRQREVAARLRRTDRGDVLDDVAAAVDDHAPAAGRAAEPRLLRELDAFLARVLVAGEADDLRRHFAARVVAPVFVLLVQSLDSERQRALGRLGRRAVAQRTRTRRRP